MTDAEATKAGFKHYWPRPLGLEFQIDPSRNPLTLDQRYTLTTQEYQDRLCEKIIDKLKLCFPSSQVTERYTPIQSSATGYASNRTFALEAVVDGVKSLDDAIWVTIDVHTGNIVSGGASMIPETRYIRVGKPLTDSEIRAICLKHGLNEVTISRIWYPFNFVVRSKASVAHERDNAVAIFVKFKEGKTEKRSMVNNLGEYTEDANLSIWQTENMPRKGKPPL